MTTEKPDTIKIDFYALGQPSKFSEFNNTKNHIPIIDYSNNLLERNALSLNSSNLEKIRNNYKSLHTSNEINHKETNNYLNPINMYKSKDIYKLNSNFTNKETFNIFREKHFAKDINPAMNNGMNLAKADYINKKNSKENDLRNVSENRTLPEIMNKNSKGLKENTFFFDKSTKNIIRYHKGFWDYNEK